jgi:hypothetical protein
MKRCLSSKRSMVLATITLSLVIMLAFQDLTMLARAQNSPFVFPSPRQFVIPPAPPYSPIQPGPTPQPARPAPPGPSTITKEKGVVNPRTGEFLPGTFGGVIDPETGFVWPKVEGGYRNPMTGEIIPNTE